MRVTVKNKTNFYGKKTAAMVARTLPLKNMVGTDRHQRLIKNSLFYIKL